MSDTSGDRVGVGFYADPESEARLTQVIGDAVAGGFEKGMDRLGQILSRNSTLLREFRKIEDAAKRSGSKIADSLLDGLTDAQKGTARFADAYKKMGLALSTINKQVDQDTVRFSKHARQLAEEEISARRREALEKIRLSRQEFVERNATLTRENQAAKAAATERLQAQRAALDAIGRAERQASQESVVATRVAGQQRVAITRAVIDQIQRLERTGASLLKGIGGGILGGVGAAGRAAGGGIANLFRREATEVNQGNRVLERELRERESVFRTSFRRQETLLRETVTRQSRQVEKLRTIGSHGIAGAVTGRGIGGGIGLAGLGAGIGVGALLTEGFRDATNLTEQLNKNKVVFGQFSDEIVKFSETSVNALGVTQAKALEATGTFGNLFRALGLTEQQSTFMSVSLTNLATDLASFNNATPEEAFEAIRSGLVGEQEPLRKFGVNLNDVTLKAKALELGLYSGKGVLDANAKAQAAFALILEQTTLAQGDWARTADEGANAQKRAKAAVQQTFSALAGLLKGFVTFLANTAVPVFNTLTNLITGKNLSDGLNLLRDGIKGVGIALGVLIAAKAGVELLSTLGAVAKLALTPMGAFVTLALGLGAAIGILLPRSQEFRDGLASLVDKLKEIGGKVKDFVQPIIERLVNWITATALPALGKFAMWVGDHLVKAFDATVSFVQTKVIPGLKAFGSFLVDTVLPPVVRFGGLLVHWFGVGLDKVVEFWNFVKPFIQPAIDGFLQLGDAVGAVFTNFDFSKLASGFKAAVSGVVSTLGTGGLVGAGVGGVLGGLVGGPIGAAIGAAIGIAVAKAGPTILEALKPIGLKVLDFLGNIFTGANFSRLAGGILDFVEFIGYQIGSHADVIIEALGAVVAAAAIVAFRFAKGFVEGLSESLPRLLGDIAGLIADNFGTVLIAAVVGLGVVRPLLSAFKSLGQQSGKAFGTGMAEAQGFIASRIGGLLKGAAVAAAGFFAGRAEGASGGSGALSAIGTGLTTLAVSKSPLLALGATAVSLIGTEMGKADRIAEAFTARVKTLASAIKQQLGDALAAGTGGVIDLTTALAGDQDRGVRTAIRETLDPRTLDTLLKAGIFESDIIRAFKGGKGDVEALVASFVDLGSSDLDTMLSSSATAGRDLIAVFAALKKAIDELNTSSAFQGGGADGNRAKGRGFSLPDAGFNTRGPVGFSPFAAADPAPTLRAIDIVQGRLSTYQRNIDLATKALYNLFHPKKDPTGADVNVDAIRNRAIVATQSLGKQVEDVLTQAYANSGQPGVAALANAQASELKGKFADDITTAVTDAAAAGLITDQASALKFVQPILDAVLVGVTDPRIKDDFTKILTDAIGDVTFDDFVENLRRAAVGKTYLDSFGDPSQVVDPIQSYVTEHPITIPVTDNAESQGKHFSAGLAIGILNGINDIRVAAQKVAHAAEIAIADQWGIHSPSTVGISLGRSVGEGLAIGLQDSVSDIGSLVASAIDDAIATAQNAADRGRDALSGAFAGIFGLGGGGGASGGAIAGITSGIQGFLSSFDSTVSKVFDLAEKQQALLKGLKDAVPLSAADLDILGESAFSLNPADVLGVSNIAALTQALAAIKDFGQVLLQQGQSPQYVADAVAMYVKQLTDQAVALGFSSDEVNQLVSNLGLSNDALAAFLAAAEAAAAGINTAVKTIFDVVKEAAAAAAIGSALHPDSYISDLVASLPEGVKALIKNMSHADLVKALASGALGDLGGLDPELVARFIEASYGGGSGGYRTPPGEMKEGDPGAPPGEQPSLDSLPRQGSNVFYIYPPTSDPYAIALEVNNRLATAASLPGG